MATLQLPREWMSFESDTLYILLSLRGDATPASGFHWGLYHCYDSTPSRLDGYKYHIKQMAAGWIADHGRSAGIYKSNYLVCAFAIAQMSPEARQGVETAIKADDDQINAIPNVTCRVWVLRQIDRLREMGLYRGPTTTSIQAEAIAFGEANRQSANQADKPRPVGRHSNL